MLAFAALGDGDKAGELFTLLNPINHASTRAGVHRYKVEPYVVAADIYLVSRARGRALRSRSAITRRATTSSSRIHTAWRGGWRLLRSMVHHSWAAACHPARR